MGKFSIEAIFKAVDGITAPINKMEDRVLKFSARTRANLSALEGFNGRIHGGIMKIAGAAAVAGAGVGAVALDLGKAGASFDQQMADLAAVSLKSRGEIADLEAKARELGATTKFTATEVGAAMELMAKAGFENKDILQGVSGMLAAAAAEGGEFTETAGHISNVLKGMGLETSRAGEVADILALASVKTNSSISSLGESMSNVAATARDFNIPLKDVVAGVALLQDVGLDASVAGSAMNTMLNKLATPTDKVKEKMRTLGVTFQDAKGNMLPLIGTIDSKGKKLPGVFDQLAKAATKSGGNMKVAAFFAELVGARGEKAAKNFAKMFKEGKFQELSDALARAGGSAERMASLRMDTLMGDIEQLGGSVDELKIRLFDLNKGPLREIVQKTNAWVDANKDLITEEVQGRIKWLVDNLPTIWTWMKRIGTAVGAFYAFATAVKVVNTAIAGWELVVRGAAAATRLWAMWSAAELAIMKKMRPELFVARREIEQVAAQTQAASTAGAGWAEKMASVRGALNAKAFGSDIKGLTMLMNAGLLAAVASISYEFGSWLNDTLELDKVINDLIDRVGKRNAVDRAGGRRKKPGIGKGEVQELGDGTVVSDKGEVVKLGTAALNKAGDIAGPGARAIAAQERDSFLREEEGFKKMRLNPLMRKSLEFARAKAHGEPLPMPASDRQVVTPQEMTARTITETQHTEKAEVTLKVPDGVNAEVTKKPKSKGFGLKLQPSGAF